MMKNDDEIKIYDKEICKNLVNYRHKKCKQLNNLQKLIILEWEYILFNDISSGHWCIFSIDFIFHAQSIFIVLWLVSQLIASFLQIPSNWVDYKFFNENRFLHFCNSVRFLTFFQITSFTMSKYLIPSFWAQNRDHRIVWIAVLA